MVEEKIEKEKMKSIGKNSEEFLRARENKEFSPIPQNMEKEKGEMKEEKKRSIMPSKRKEEKKAEAKKETKKSNFKFSAEKDPWKIIQYPMLTEKNIRSVEAENKLAFIVRREASKPQIKWAVEAALEVQVDRINTLIDRRGRKKAIVKLSPKFKAIDIATRFGML